MKTVEILAGFTGYPSDKKRHFAKGEEPSLPDAYADMLVDKKLAREKPTTTEPPKAAAKK